MNPAKLPPLESDAELVAKHDFFADIIAGRAPASVVYRDELVTAFMDIHPINEGHTLVVPLRPARFLDELDDAEAARMFVVGREIARAIRATLPSTGILMFLADGVTAGQEVPHTHLHVVPRLAGDGFGFSLPARYGADLPERESLEVTAATLRAAFTKLP